MKGHPCITCVSDEMDYFELHLDLATCLHNRHKWKRGARRAGMEGGSVRERRSFCSKNLLLFISVFAGDCKIPLADTY